MNEWQPIETAPRDGTIIILWYKAEGHEMAFWNGRSWDDGDYYDNLGSDADFTHWMPLPPAPLADRQALNPGKEMGK